jgi:hypothetical protein
MWVSAPSQQQFPSLLNDQPHGALLHRTNQPLPPFSSIRILPWHGSFGTTKGGCVRLAQHLLFYPFYLRLRRRRCIVRTGRPDSCSDAMSSPCLSGEEEDHERGGEGMNLGSSFCFLFSFLARSRRRHRSRASARHLSCRDAGAVWRPGLHRSWECLGARGSWGDKLRRRDGYIESRLTVMGKSVKGGQGG